MTIPVLIDPKLNDIATMVEIDAIIADLAELRSRSRVLEYFATGWIMPEMALEIMNTLDEVMP